MKTFLGRKLNFINFFEAIDFKFYKNLNSVYNYNYKKLKINNQTKSPKTYKKQF